MRDEKRPGPRVGAEVVVRLAAATTEEFIERHGQHVTRGGLFVRLAEPVAVGTRVAFQLCLSSGDLVLVGSGVVAWATAASPGAAPSELPGIGITFGTLDPTSRSLVDFIVATRGGEASVDEPPRPPAGAVYLESAPPVVSIPVAARPPAPTAPAASAPARGRRSSTSPIVGIDLGTTNSCVAIADETGARVIASRLGYSTVPSVVAWDGAGRLLVGHQARAQMVLRPHDTVYGSKRLVGRPFASPTVQACRDRFHYEIVEGEGGAAAVRIGGQLLSLQQVAASILGELRQMASESLGQEVVRAAITVPAYYNDHQRQAVRDAGRLAGLRVERIVNEPTAAAVAFGFGKSLAKRVLVYDLGGGTFDASVVEVDGDLYEVVSTGGDTFLGGVDFDNLLVDHLVLRFQDEHGFTPPDDLTVWQRIVEAAEQTKVALSARESATAHVPELCAAPDGRMVELKVTVRRSELEELTRRLVDRTIEVCQEVLQARGLGKDDLDEVLLVGGQTRMPFIWRRIREEFGKEPSRSVHPDEAVALGAALLAQADRRVDSVVLLDALAMSIGVGLAGGRMIPVLMRNTRLPTRRTYELATTADGQRELELLIFQGDAAEVSECEYLGTAILAGLPPGPRGTVRIAVEFSLGNEGILSLAARDVQSGNSVEVRFAKMDTPLSLLQKLQLPQAPVAPRGARPILTRLDGRANRAVALAQPAASDAPPSGGAARVVPAVPPPASAPAVATERAPAPEPTEAQASKKGLFSRFFGRR